MFENEPDVSTVPEDIGDISTVQPYSSDDVSTTDAEYTFDENYVYYFKPENYEDDDFGGDYTENTDEEKSLNLSKIFTLSNK